MAFKELHPAGVEPTTYGFGGRHSIQLSYGCFGEFQSLRDPEENIKRKTTENIRGVAHVERRRSFPMNGHYAIVMSLQR